MDQAVCQKWQYVVEETNSANSLRERLNRLGADGWELVNVIHNSSVGEKGPVKSLRVRRDDAFCAVLKRPIC